MGLVAWHAQLADIVAGPAVIGAVALPWLVAFVATQVVEVPIYLLAQRRGPSERNLSARLWIAFAPSAITHPIAWGLGLILHPFWVHALVAETFAVVVEALWLRRRGVPQATWWSLTANAASVAIFIFARSLLRG